MNKPDTGSVPHTYLFAWNPAKWPWPTLEQDIEQLEISGRLTDRWTCRSHKKVKPGDRAFLVKVGAAPRGIFASGYVASEPFLSGYQSDPGKNIHRVLIDFEVLLNPDKDPILTLDILRSGALTQQEWTPQSSGISVRDDITGELEAVWFDFLTTQKLRHRPYTSSRHEAQRAYTEGAAAQMMQTRYERNPFARAACIAHYGCTCAVCGFDFEERYGEIGRDFIHVHHQSTLAGADNAHPVDPIEDLRPVCPNCHAMLHRHDPPFTIEALKLMLKNT